MGDGQQEIKPLARLTLTHSLAKKQTCPTLNPFNSHSPVSLDRSQPAVEGILLMQTIAPHDLEQLRQAGQPLRVIDVRTPAEHAQIHIPGVELMPLDRLDPARLRASGCAADTPLYLVCRGGGRATEAAKRLEENGFHECHVLTGGTLAWEEAGLPVTRGPGKVIPLERQVRIAAGSLVLTGVLLAHFVHPAFIFLSAFIGAGLVFAGITDWCGMGLLLARMPWNRA